MLPPHDGRSAALLFAFLIAGTPISARAQSSTQTATPPPDERIVTAEEVRQATEPAALAPLRVLFSPYRFLIRGMEKGLITFERERVRERLRLWQDWIRRQGVLAAFGGQGEGAGLGGAGGFIIGQRPAFQVLGRMSFKGYQELDALLSLPQSKGTFELEASYQWRPQEPFYGLGHDSQRSQRSNFALRQKWVGWHVHVNPVRRVRLGAEQKLVWLGTEAGRNPRFASTDVRFPTLPGLGTDIRLQSVGGYFDADLFQGEYQWGAMARVGASYQHGLGASNLRYVRYETQLEGRMPVARGRSELVAQGSAELTRPQSGSDPVPFYLLPRVGGSATLRGFPLDRYSGHNLVLATFEYRYRIHPNIQSYVFFDEGQIFDRASDLAWLNWHRNYGLGFRLAGARSAFLRLEVGYGEEGVAVHVSFGDRRRNPIAGPVRYGSYRR